LSGGFFFRCLKNGLSPLVNSCPDRFKNQDAGMFFEPTDTDSMGLMIIRVLGDQGLRKRLVEKGFEQTLKYSWEKTAAGIIESCRKALEEYR